MTDLYEMNNSAIERKWSRRRCLSRHGDTERRPQHPSKNRMFREYSWLTGNVGISTANWFSILKILWIVHTVYLIFAVPVLCLIIHETPISVAIIVLVRVRALLRELHGVCDDLTLAEQSEWSKLTIDQGNLINITLHYEQPLKNIGEITTLNTDNEVTSWKNWGRHGLQNTRTATFYCEAIAECQRSRIDSENREPPEPTCSSTRATTESIIYSIQSRITMHVRSTYCEKNRRE